LSATLRPERCRMRSKVNDREFDKVDVS
jgi:hypothetical protein